MLKNLIQLRQEVAQSAGIKNTANIYDFDATTFPTLSQVNIFINDGIREVTSSWDYTFLQSSRSYPFQHTISGVQGVYLFGTALQSGNLSGSIGVVSGLVVPYPNEVLNYSWIANNQPPLINSNYSGIQFVGQSGVVITTGISNSGYQTVGNYNGVGYTYQLDQDVDKLIGVMLSNSNSGQTSKGIMLPSIEWHDLERLIPIGIINSSGTPSCYSEFPGFSPSNNKTIQFFPTPTSNFVGESFIAHYKKKHVDLDTDTATQNVIPEQYQALITQATLEKIFDVLDNPKAELATARKTNLVNQMRIWDANQPNKMAAWTDFTYNSLAGRSAWDNSTLIYLPGN